MGAKPSKPGRGHRRPPALAAGLPAARTRRGEARASRLFGLLTSKLVVMSPEEAELAKLFTNAWRYIKFATANQLYMMANDQGLDLGHTAMAINEGLPLYLVQRLEQSFELASLTVGILGMAFKGGCDDVRSTLSYKLKRILAFKAKAVLCADPYVTCDPDLLPAEEVLAAADLLVVATPHPKYAGLRTDKPVADRWNVRGAGVRV